MNIFRKDFTAGIFFFSVARGRPFFMIKEIRTAVKSSFKTFLFLPPPHNNNAKSGVS